jgi:hypothetical protein
VPTERRLNSATGGESDSARTQSGTQHKEQVAREALLREFLRWREQFSKQPPQAEDVAFGEFMRSLGRR